MKLVEDLLYGIIVDSEGDTVPVGQEDGPVVSMAAAQWVAAWVSTPPMTWTFTWSSLRRSGEPSALGWADGPVMRQLSSSSYQVTLFTEPAGSCRAR